ncbi:HlyD family efflux transporter periplasmic adaptor subunit [Kingella negevensis]|uniref:Putative efflux pump membrane fusion protein n=1 Tax=Kingella negevensis TaxID=1522312 RepID=A0A238HGF7_9NEIS|nr:HlyD family efflux transporter periplasmic adaptor subunit [Kingella negevensis]MDK4681332.1 HlyD family efflux transporter periplasmic adaptor subunit [Kingella negevensis]MDK4683529.1 HlyD family efflux transporter periplasmic adaptor subunit [Kingella negevensis]MDK4691336.1 HlyD family efflux transporter periplasmic adaptor subunit [Kingella negevensis]MDK4693515.1 HlyD family efflux transporter periplasmic adaptor subunit [Kingella negevensis]MDK4697412.1 HlyD family efflux transporter
MKKLILPIIILAALGGGGFYAYQRSHTSTLPANIAQSNGRLELNRFDVASLYAGRVKAMNVDEGSEVKAGDVLAELSSDTTTSRVEEAQAGELAARETVQRAQAGVKQAQAAVRQAQEAAARADAQIAAQLHQQKLAQMELNHASQLQSEELVSDAETQRRRSQRDGATAGVAAARAAKAEALAAVGQAQAALLQAQAQVQEAKAGVSAREAQMKAAESVNNDMNIVSPKNGRVEYKLAEVGNVIGAGSKVVSLLDPSDVSMNIFLPNAQVSSLKVGDEARIVLDGVDAVFPAKISFIATEAQFTPKNVETANERAKLMFKVKLKVPAETALQFNRLLKGGMTGNGFVRMSADAEWSEQLAVRLPQ